MNKYQIIKIDPNNFNWEELEHAVSILQKGGVIAYPTETVYGLGANIYYEKAVRRIFQLKKREPNKPLSIMISSFEEVEELCQKMPEYGRHLMEVFWPGPLTLIFKASDKVPKYLISKDQKIGLRMPNHPITKALMKLHHQPVTSTSANITGAKDAVNVQDVKKSFGDNIDLIIDGGECNVKIPSTVLDVTGNKPEFVRAGAISSSRIKEIMLGVGL